MQTKRVLALGFFDGVHIGHGALLRRTRALADRLGAQAAALTFDAPPAQVISGAPVALISTPDDRARLMRQLYGMDEVLVRHFDRDLMHLPWQDYIERLLLGELGAVHVVCGADHRFGFRGEGTALRLCSFCAARGVGCEIIDKVVLGGATVSSTRIRALLAQGHVTEASELLGRHHMVRGEVAAGRGEGTGMGFPTANIKVPSYIQMPADGVYEGLLLVDDTVWPAAVNVGVPPTYAADAASAHLEANLIGYAGDLYGCDVSLAFTRFLRPSRVFDSLDELIATVEGNIDDINQNLGDKGVKLA